MHKVQISRKFLATHALEQQVFQFKKGENHSRGGRVGEIETLECKQNPENDVSALTSLY